MNSQFLLFTYFLSALFLQALPSMADQTAEPKLVPQNPAPTAQNELPTDIYDIYGPLILPDPINWLLIGIIALLLLLLIGIFIVLRKKKKSEIPLIPPHVTALEELKQAREYLLNNQSLLYADRISEILRRYIEARFTITSTRQTTREFLMAIQVDAKSEANDLLPHRDQLEKCMQHCDMAKYAHKTSDKDAMEEMEQAIHQFIDTTKGVEEVN